ncbi:MAG: DJ-1/PfpI family protein [Lachnospiraceae bacterium]|nr:DJ-1/PfpI family protein [Lachnospiraceae bacterium]
MAKTLIFLATGFEEIEGLMVVDLLRRAKIDIQMVSITGDIMVTGSHGITVKADTLIEDVDFSKADALVLPGGMPGTRNLQAHNLLNEELKKANEAGKLLCAICAAPLVLGTNHILEGKKACCYPGFEDELLGAITNENPVTHDGNTITSRGLGTAIAFAAEIITTLCDKGTADQVLESIIYA